MCEPRKPAPPLIRQVLTAPLVRAKPLRRRGYPRLACLSASGEPRVSGPTPCEPPASDTPTAHMSAANHAAGELLWTPSAERIERSRMTAYMRWLADERGVEVAGYEELWRWSVDHVEDFWRSI